MFKLIGVRNRRQEKERRKKKRSLEIKLDCIIGDDNWRQNRKEKFGPTKVERKKETLEN